MAELLHREVDEKTPPLDEKTVDSYLAEHPEDAGRAAGNRSRVRIYLTQQARGQRKSDFLASLREKAGYRFLLEPPPRPRTKIAIDGEPWRGNQNAPVTLVHFASFTDKLSAASVEMIQRLMHTYPHRIKWVHRNFFLINDEKVLSAALMGEAAHNQGKFWDFHDRMFTLKGHFEPDVVTRIAGEIGLSRPYYENGEKEGRFLLKVKDDIRTAARIGVTTVPVIFVNGLYFSPTFPFEQLQALVSKELDRLAGYPNPSENASSSNRGGSD